MMATYEELQRLAGAVNIMRPEWPTASTLTLLQRDHSNRAYADLAVALVAVAADPRSKTPRRLNEAGPWWQLTNSRTTGDVGPGNEPHCPTHPTELDRLCRSCRSEDIARKDER